MFLINNNITITAELSTNILTLNQIQKKIF